MTDITENMIQEAFDSILDSNDTGAELLAKLAFELKEQNEKLIRGLEVYQRERDRFKHSHPELTGVFFLASGYGETDENMLPQYVEIVAAYGCGWSQVYEKTERTISYEGS